MDSQAFVGSTDTETLLNPRVEQNMSIEEFYHLETDGLLVRYLQDEHGLGKEEEVKGSGMDGYKIRVGLQFPDYLLYDSVEVCFELQTRFNDGLFFVCGDTSYGECCVDEVNAEHLKADLIFHFGRSCLSQSSRIKVVHIFEKLSGFDSTNFQDQIQSELDPDDPIIIISETGHQWSATDLPYTIAQPTSDLSTIPTFSTNSDHTNKLTILGREVTTPDPVDLGITNLIFIGNEESPTYKCLSTNYTGQVKSIWVYEPTEMTLTKSPGNQNKFLMQRYNVIEKIKKAEIIGVIMGTLAVDNMNSVRDLLIDTIKGKDKKAYEFLIGKLNEPKLLNFGNVDLFVIISCRENSIYEIKEFNIPVATPHEILIALHPAWQWESSITTDFNQVITKHQSKADNPTIDQCDEDSDDSIEKEEKAVKMALMKKTYGELMNVFEPVVIERFQELTFKGLELNEGARGEIKEGDFAELEDGLTGIASKYEKEGDL